MSITEEDFTRAMREAVAERGRDYLYPKYEAMADAYHDAGGTCVYTTPDGTPACIIGLALHKIDPGLVPKYGNTIGANRLLPLLGAPSAVAIAAFQAQCDQDLGSTWGEALDAYERKMEQIA